MTLSTIYSGPHHSPQLNSASSAFGGSFPIDSIAGLARILLFEEQIVTQSTSIQPLTTFAFCVISIRSLCTFRYKYTWIFFTFIMGPLAGLRNRAPSQPNHGYLNSIRITTLNVHIVIGQNLSATTFSKPGTYQKYSLGEPIILVGSRSRDIERILYFVLSLAAAAAALANSKVVVSASTVDSAGMHIAQLTAELMLPYRERSGVGKRHGRRNHRTRAQHRGFFDSD